MGIIIDPNFSQWRKATQGDYKRKDRVFAVSLFSSDYMFAYLKFAKLCEHVKKYGHADLFTLAQERKFGNPINKISNNCYN